MRGLQKITAMVFVFAMLLSVSVSAFAAITQESVDGETSTPENFDQNQAKTTVSVIHPTETTQLSATVPLNITFAIYDSGKFECPSNYKIVNNGSEYIHVSDISIKMLDTDYALVKDTKLDEKQIYLTLSTGNDFFRETINLESENEKQTYGEGEKVKAWNIEGNGSLPLMFEGKVNGIKENWNNTAAELFTITYTIEAGYKDSTQS